MKRVLLVIGAILLVVVPIVGVKASQIFAMIQAGESFVPPPESVSASTVTKDQWQGKLSAVGTVVASKSVTITTEVPGTVSAIRFESGDRVRKGALLVRLDTSVEQAELKAAEAAERLAKASFTRAQELRKVNANSKAELESAEATSMQSEAEIARLRAVISRKTLTAPFAGRLGIREVNPGQFLNAGTPVTTLVSTDEVYADFFLPQGVLGSIGEGFEVNITTDAVPGDVIKGKVDTTDALVQTSTRNVKVRAVFDNEGEKLKPGMFVNVSVNMPDDRGVLLVPASAILYAPYGDSVYVIEKAQQKKDDGKEAPDTGSSEGESSQSAQPPGSDLVVNQRFVRLGERRGDFVEVLSGVEEGERVVSAGAFKLKNGMSVVVTKDKALKPELSPNPKNE